MEPPKPSTSEGALHRAPRPIMGWVAVYLGLILVAFISVVLFSWARGFLLTAALARPVPDMTGGIGQLAGVIAAISAALWQGLQWMQNRHRERRDEIAFSGGQVAVPPSGSSDGPRPGDSA